MYLKIHGLPLHYAANTGLWNPTSDADKQTLQDLVNKYVQNVVDYQAFACCHHTDPFSFNNDVASMFTGSNAVLQKFNQLFKEMSATNQDLLSNNQPTTDNVPETQKAVNGSSTSSNNNGQSSGSSQGSQGSSGQSQSGVGVNGASAAVTGSAGSNSNGAGESSAQSSGESSSKVYELNQDSQPSSGSEASLPIEVMALIIAILVIFGYGFFKKGRNEEFEEY